jgi:purine-nucleoside phosphorylase
MLTLEPFETSAAFIQTRYPHPIQIVAILGSGLGDLAASCLQHPVKIPSAEIPFFPVSGVKGHEGNLYLGEIRPGVHFAVLQGRVHYYEGHPLSTVVYPLRTLRLLGAEILLVTNAAGGVNADFHAGDLMLIEDHLNMMGSNPLIGQNLDRFGPRFPDMSDAYTHSLRQLAEQKAQEVGISIRKGVYCAMSGPAYETPAEVRMIRSWGADAVGMSTVPEVITAAHMGMKVLGISCITNAAAGVIEGHRLNHQEVLEAAEQAKAEFSRWLQAILMAISEG